MLGVVSPAPCLESELEVQLKCSWGFSSADLAAVESHLADCEPDRFACSKWGEAGLHYDDGDMELWWARAHPDEIVCGDCKGPEVADASVQTERPAAGKSKRGNCKQKGHAKQETD